MIWWPFHRSDLPSRAEQMRLAHSHWLTGALASGRPYPKIPLRRVAEGGHDVPEVDLRRRFARSLDNLPGYLKLADIWRLFDSDNGRPRIIAEKHAQGIEIVDPTSLSTLPPPIPSIV